MTLHTGISIVEGGRNGWCRMCTLRLEIIMLGPRIILSSSSSSSSSSSLPHPPSKRQRLTNPSSSSNSSSSSSSCVMECWKELEICAGGIVGWSGRLLHASKQPTRRAKNPRVSLAFAASAEPFESPTLRLPGREGGRPVALGECVSLSDRLQIIAIQSWTYEHRVPFSRQVRSILMEMEHQ